MAKIRIDSGGIAEIRTIVEQQAQTMQMVEQTIDRVLMNLDVKIAAAENIMQSLISLKHLNTKEREMLTGISNILIRVNDEFGATDHGLSDKARDVNYAMDYIIAEAAAGFREGIPLKIQTNLIDTESLSALFGLSAISTIPLNLQLLFLDGVNKASSLIKDAADYSEWIDVLFDNEMFGDILDSLGKINKNDFFKVTGYLGDGKKLINALNTGDFDALESLSEKYLKKGVKAATELATGTKVSGVVNSVYLDLGWNLGLNAAESVKDFIADPSVESAASGLWNITVGTFFDAGTALAKDALSFAGDITGQGFDTEDFSNAMDYLWNHPIESLAATIEVVEDGVADFFDWLF